MWHPRHWPWWGWVIATLSALALVLLVAALLIRHNGRRELAAEIARAEAEGRSIALHDLLATTPVLDPTRQTEAWALVGSSDFACDSTQTTHGLYVRTVRAGDRAKLDQETGRLLAASLVARQRWHALVQSGPVCISILGWLVQDHPDTEHFQLADLETVRFPSLMCMRALAIALATQARVEQDPLPALHDLDALCAALRPSGCLIDAMIALPVSDIRDEAWIEAISRGCDPTPFVAGDGADMATILEGWRGERRLFLNIEIQECFAGRSTQFRRMAGAGAPSPGEVFMAALGNTVASVSDPYDLALCLRIDRETERLATSGNGSLSAIAADLRAKSLLPFSAARSYLSMSKVIGSVAKSSISARLLRLTGLIIAAQLRTPTLPDQLTDPRAVALLAASPVRPALTYQRLDAHRFRLVVDSATCNPAMIPPADIKLPAAVASRAAWRQSRFWLELDLTALDAP